LQVPQLPLLELLLELLELLLQTAVQPLLVQPLFRQLALFSQPQHPEATVPVHCGYEPPPHHVQAAKVLPAHKSRSIATTKILVVFIISPSLLMFVKSFVKTTLLKIQHWLLQKNGVAFYSIQLLLSAIF
jgi:hypothetical protein